MITRKEIEELARSIDKAAMENTAHWLEPADIIESGFIEFLEERGLLAPSFPEETPDQPDSETQGEKS